MCLDYDEDEYEDDNEDEDDEDYPQNRQGQHQSMDDILADMYRMARNMPGCVGFGVVIL